MSQTYFALLTAVGEAKLANAAALGTQLQISRMAVGDGGGVLPTPDRLQSALLGEKYRADLNELKPDPLNANQIIAELVIPEATGGWWLREMGLYDAAGDLIAVSNCPPSYKPQMAEGSGRTQVLRMVLIVSSTAAVQLKIDPSVVLATRAYVVTTVNALELRTLTAAAAGAQGQVPVRSAAPGPGHPVIWEAPGQLAGAAVHRAAPFTAVPGARYYLAGTFVVTLPPVAALAPGAAVSFIKLIAATPTIQVHGGSSEQIKTSNGSDTAVTFDINAEIVLVWTGTTWEV